MVGRVDRSVELLSTITLTPTLLAQDLHLKIR